ncbi:nucleotidyl transferase AbiEii/AbiGii toxin family protein [Pectobacterium punjabense]|uniref:nucleotidyl transferase AbiEii/AbiGii toxin family protein n=1 Tax=Pectobacterium punjabense TaxID=2108399 RepID=UPI003D9BDF32
MNSFFQENDTERRKVFLAAQLAHPQQLPAYIIEKDFYVTCILYILYVDIAPKLKDRSPTPFVFKGGTSLSKCCNLINRMSEDIDLSFSMDLLACHEVKRDTEKSRKQMENEADEIDEKARQFVLNELIEPLTVALKAFDQRIEVIIENDEPLHLGIHYPSVIEEGTAVLRRVLLETGSLSQNNPVGRIDITHMLGDIIPNIKAPKFSVDYLKPERTMVEKIFGVHCNLLSGRPRTKYARHLYDILKLHEQDNAWCENKQLLLDHVEFSDIHYRTNLNYCNTARTGPLQLCPKSTDMIEHYRNDWEAMADMFPNSNLPYTFEELLPAMQRLETHINTVYYQRSHNDTENRDH